MRNLYSNTTPTKSLRKNRTSGAVSVKSGATCALTYSDEYYTKYVIVYLLIDIITEVNPDAFRGKIVYCNCDTQESNIVKCFRNRFVELGMKKLVATGMSCTDWRGTKYEYDGKEEKVTALDWSGAFNSYECRAVLDDCDIVFTNPPFSQITEYVDTVVRSGKKFVCFMSNINVTYEKIFRLYRDGVFNIILNQYGVEGFYKDRIPDRMDRRNMFTNPTGIDPENCRVNAIVVSNIDGSDSLEKRLVKTVKLVKYEPDRYRNFDNIDAINIDSIHDIPDTDKILGVPVSIMCSHCCDRDQFEIIDVTNDCYVNGKLKFKRILVKLKKYAK